MGKHERKSKEERTELVDIHYETKKKLRKKMEGKTQKLRNNEKRAKSLPPPEKSLESDPGQAGAHCTHSPCPGWVPGTGSRAEAQWADPEAVERG